MKRFLSLTALLLLFSACVKDKPSNAVQPQVQLSNSKKVYVVSEGIFPSGQGEISLYDPATGNVVENFYKTQNNEGVGNVAQSMNYFNSNYYLVINNAHKVIVCDGQLKKTAVISGLTSPRYILQVTNEKAYVSDLYANAVNVVDLNLNLKTAQISFGGETERMALIYNKVFVTAPQSNYVYIINTLTDAKTDSIFVGKGASSIVIDGNDKIWVLGDGDEANMPGQLTRINALTNQVEWSAQFGSNQLPGNLCLNKTKDTLYFLNSGICRMSIADNTLPPDPLVPQGNKNFYGLGVNPNDYSIYASDALDYNQRSTIYIFDSRGNQKTFFKGGIISNSFYFE